MEIRLEKNQGTPLRGIEPVLTAIQGRLDKEPQGWLKQLQANRVRSPIWKRTCIGLFNRWRTNWWRGCWLRRRPRQLSRMMLKKSDRR